jgi:hypothetical protein
MKITGKTTVMLFVDTDDAWMEEWKGSLDDWLTANDDSETVDFTFTVIDDLANLGYHMIGGGSSPTFKLVVL